MLAAQCPVTLQICPHPAGDARHIPQQPVRAEHRQGFPSVLGMGMWFGESTGCGGKRHAFKNTAWFSRGYTFHTGC